MAASFRSPAKVARRIKLAPLASRSLKSWPTFIYHYSLGLVPGSPYRFRSGARIQIGRGVDHVPIIEIFFRRDYGTIPDNSIVIDLGANIGVFSVYAAMSGNNVQVYSYEPVKDFYKLLQANVALNFLADRIKCFNLAVAGDDRQRELVVAGHNIFFPTFEAPTSDISSIKSRVQCTTLEQILDNNSLAKVDILKIDVEGAEYETLYGSSPAALSRIAEIRMEYHCLDNENRNVHALKTFLVSKGFRITHEQVNTPTNGTVWAAR